MKENAEEMTNRGTHFKVTVTAAVANTIAVYGYSYGYEYKHYTQYGKGSSKRNCRA